MGNYFSHPPSEAQKGLYSECNITKIISNQRRKRRKDAIENTKEPRTILHTTSLL